MMFLVTLFGVCLIFVAFILFYQCFGEEKQNTAKNVKTFIKLVDARDVQGYKMLADYIFKYLEYPDTASFMLDNYKQCIRKFECFLNNGNKKLLRVSERFKLYHGYAFSKDKYSWSVYMYLDKDHECKFILSLPIYEKVYNTEAINSVEDITLTKEVFENVLKELENIIYEHEIERKRIKEIQFQLRREVK